MKSGKIVEMQRIYRVTVILDDYSDGGEDHLEIIEWAEENFGESILAYDIDYMQRNNDLPVHTEIKFQFSNKAAAVETKLRWT